MFGFRSRTEDHTNRVRKAADKAAYKNFGHAAASIRKDAASTLSRRQGPSAPGEPPHVHRRGRNLRMALRYFANKIGAVIGPRYSIIGTVGQAHEFGGVYKGQEFEERPFMGPALERNLDRFAGEWAGSIGE